MRTRSTPAHTATVRGLALADQLFVGARPERRRLAAPTNRPGGWEKPARGGLWTSTLRADGGSAWTDWLADEMPHREAAHWRLAPAPAGRLLVVDCRADLLAALDAYPDYAVDGAPRFLPDVETALDFARMARAGLAGVHLTERGNAAVHRSLPGLLTWDTESTCWLRWAFVGEPVPL